MTWLDLDTCGWLDGLQRAIVEARPGELILLRSQGYGGLYQLTRHLRYWSGRRGTPSIQIVELEAGERPMARLSALGLDRGQRTSVVLTGLEKQPASDETARALLELDLAK